jgi:hypothetical protein
MQDQETPRGTARANQSPQTRAEQTEVKKKSTRSSKRVVTREGCAESGVESDVPPLANRRKLLERVL